MNVYIPVEEAVNIANSEYPDQEKAIEYLNSLLQDYVEVFKERYKELWQNACEILEIPEYRLHKILREQKNILIDLKLQKNLDRINSAINIIDGQTRGTSRSMEERLRQEAVFQTSYVLIEKDKLLLPGRSNTRLRCNKTEHINALIKSAIREKRASLTEYENIHYMHEYLQILESPDDLTILTDLVSECINLNNGIGDLKYYIKHQLLRNPDDPEAYALCEKLQIDKKKGTKFFRNKEIEKYFEIIDSRLKLRNKTKKNFAAAFLLVLVKHKITPRKGWKMTDVFIKADGTEFPPNYYVKKYTSDKYNKYGYVDNEISSLWESIQKQG